jgi:ABC-type multidrug transport system fused ATPase/permease subunit
MYQQIEKKGGLNSQITKDSLSSGEKQMICICRALLKKNPIILVDEASANIDERNDFNIQ